jgi:hypothetical protein
MSLFEYILYYLTWFKNLLFLNVLKSISLLLCFILFYYAGSFPDVVEWKPLVSNFEDSGLNVYVYKSEGYKDFKVLTSEVNLEVKSGLLRVVEYNDLNVLFWFLFGIIILINFIIIISGDDDWSLERVSKRTFISFIRCELEEGFYHYLFLGRLCLKSSVSLGTYELSRLVVSFSSVKSIYPKFTSKRELRLKKLSLLGL